jgi:hypothetical protein
MNGSFLFDDLAGLLSIDGFLMLRHDVYALDHCPAAHPVNLENFADPSFVLAGNYFNLIVFLQTCLSLPHLLILVS